MLDCTASGWTGDPGCCRWCNDALPKRRRRWCSNECSDAYLRNHLWSWASAARKHAYPICEEDGCAAYSMETHHVVPILGRHGVMGCHHHQDGLRALCTTHHYLAHAALRAAG